jgi:hypothetical protein
MDHTQLPHYDIRWSVSARTALKFIGYETDAPSLKSFWAAL